MRLLVCFLVSISEYMDGFSEMRITNELGQTMVAACDNEMVWMDGWMAPCYIVFVTVDR